MLIGVGIRDFVLVDSADLQLEPGLTALTGETGAGKSVVLGALALALGGRSDAAMIRAGAAQAVTSAIFTLPAEHPAAAWLEEKAIARANGEDLVLRRGLSVDGRSRGFVNDQPVAIGALRELGGLLVETHGQHETVGLLDARTYVGLLDAYGGLGPKVAGCLKAWSGLATAEKRLAALLAAHDRTRAESQDVADRLAELDRLSPREGEESGLAAERRLLAAAGKAMAELSLAREQLDDDLVIARIAQARRAVERARETVVRALGEDIADVDVGGAPDGIASAADALDRALAESVEAAALLDAAAQAFEAEPERLDRVEERLFALRALARKLGVEVEALGAERTRLAQRLLRIEGAADELAQARADVGRADLAYEEAAATLTAGRLAAADRLAAAVAAELKPLRLGKARFRVTVEPLGKDQRGPGGADRVGFEIATLPGAPFGSLASIASGGELARLALALKVCLAGRGKTAQPVMIFDEVDQGVGGAVADAVGQRLARLAQGGQVIVVTHSPQVAARADTHWRVTRERRGDQLVARIEVLTGARREEELARMLAGATITDAARAAARALMDA